MEYLEILPVSYSGKKLDAISSKLNDALFVYVEEIILLDCIDAKTFGSRVYYSNNNTDIEGTIHVAEFLRSLSALQDLAINPKMSNEELRRTNPKSNLKQKRPILGLTSLPMFSIVDGTTFLYLNGVGSAKTFAFSTFSEDDENSKTALENLVDGVAGLFGISFKNNRRNW